MTVVVSFDNYTPPARFDDLPWTNVRIQEAPLSTGTWVQIDEQDLDPTDSDPSDPQARSFTTDLGTAAAQWYRVVWVDAASAVSAATSPTQNIPLDTYATATELFRILKVRTPTTEQTVAADGDLATATLEINAEIDFAVLAPTSLDTDQLDLLKGVCLDRAADLWRHRESVPGIVGIPDEAMPSTFGRYSWNRYAERLAPLKSRWGLA